RRRRRRPDAVRRRGGVVGGVQGMVESNTTAKQRARPRTVAAELRRRRDCRYGLRGVRIGVRDEPGAAFVCDASSWDEHGRLVIDLVPEARWEEFERSRPRGLITMAQLLAYAPPPHLRRGVPAERCLLLSDWPEVCPCWK